MYGKGKGTTVHSDAQAREKLAVYVYEYLLHVGATKAAQTFLSEIRWEKNITLGDPPGFLHSWWCVFWDLYCAAPERRDTSEHSNEAKAFHDYGFVNSGFGVNGNSHGPGHSPSPMGQLPPPDGMGGPGGPMPPGFFPNSGMRPLPPNHPSSQPSPHSQPAPSQILSNQPFMGPRYPGGPRPGPVRMSQFGNEFNGYRFRSFPLSEGETDDVAKHYMSGPPMMSGPMDPTRPGPGGMPPGMGPRMNPPRPGMGPLGPSYGPGPGLRMPPGPGMSGGMPMGGQGRPQWPPNNGPMNYNSSSPGSYGGPPAPPGPGTPITSSPQDSSNSGENMYGMMKREPGGNMSGEFPMGGGPDGGSMPMGPGMSAVMSGDGMDMKHSPQNGPGTPRNDGGPSEYGGLAGFSRGPPGNEQAESAAILKIKESMQEEAKRFEKDSEPDYFMQ